MAKTRFKSVTDYIASKPPSVQPILKRVRSAIRKAIPKAEEGIAYQIASYTMNGTHVIYFAGWKDHYALYPIHESLVAAFKKELTGCKFGKGTLRFPFSEPVPSELIERIVRFRLKQMAESEKGRKKKGQESQLERVRRICASLPSAFEKPSHGAPAFFVEKYKGVFATFMDNHHQDGELAVWLASPPDLQSALIEDAPETYFKPPYVGVNGWIGVRLDRIGDEALGIHLNNAWKLTRRGKSRA